MVVWVVGGETLGATAVGLATDMVGGAVQQRWDVIRKPTGLPSLWKVGFEWKRGAKMIPKFWPEQLLEWSCYFLEMRKTLVEQTWKRVGSLCRRQINSYYCFLTHIVFDLTRHPKWVCQVNSRLWARQSGKCRELEKSSQSVYHQREWAGIDDF